MIRIQLKITPHSKNLLDLKLVGKKINRYNTEMTEVLELSENILKHYGKNISMKNYKHACSKSEKKMSAQKQKIKEIEDKQN